MTSCLYDTYRYVPGTDGVLYIRYCILSYQVVIAVINSHCVGVTITTWEFGEINSMGAVECAAASAHIAVLYGTRQYEPMDTLRIPVRSSSTYCTGM